MRFDSKKVFKFAGEVSGCVVMGIVSAATQTLWYRIAEPKILNAMDKNEAKRKQPIGFRGGVLTGASLLFADFATRIMERMLAQLVERRVEFPYVIGSSPIQLL